jgi:hypothetical protein
MGHKKNIPFSSPKIALKPAPIAHLIFSSINIIKHNLTKHATKNQFAEATNKHYLTHKFRALGRYANIPHSFRFAEGNY